MSHIQKVSEYCASGSGITLIIRTENSFSVMRNNHMNGENYKASQTANDLIIIRLSVSILSVHFVTNRYK